GGGRRGKLRRPFSCTPCQDYTHDDRRRAAGTHSRYSGLPASVRYDRQSEDDRKELGVDTTRRVDVTFAFRQDTPPGKEPDASSPTVRRYEKLLWSKPLPGGVVFDLDDATPPYLHHQSKVGEFFLSSDAVIPTFSRERRISNVISQIPAEEREAFNRIG